MLSPPAIEWSHAAGMLTPLLQCLSLWVEQTTTGATQVHMHLYIYNTSVAGLTAHMPGYSSIRFNTHVHV